MIYFDNAGSTIVDSDVLNLFNEDTKKYIANPSALHALGMKENYDIVNFKRELLTSLKLSPSTHDVIFTSGATEANNLAILGYARKNKNKGNHLIVSKIEHPSVLNTFRELEKEGFEVTYLDVKNDGTIDINEFKKAIKDTTILVSTMFVNNECGCILNVEEIRAAIKESGNKKIVLHSDLAQSFGKYKIDFNLFDLFTISAYKIHGIKGIGALIKRKNVDLEPLVYGGGQEDNLRSGTLSYSLIHAAVYTFIKGNKEVETKNKYIQELHDYAISKLREIDEIKVHSDFSRKSPYIINFSTLKKEASIVVEALSNKEIYVSSKSSCSSKLKAISYVIHEITKNEEEALNSIRISFSKYNKIEEIDEFINALKEILASIKGK